MTMGQMDNMNIVFQRIFPEASSRPDDGAGVLDNLVQVQGTAVR